MRRLRQVHTPDVTVGVTTVEKKTLSRHITLSSELVPFQEIDVYAKESGYVKSLNVDYGSHVKAGQVMATLEIPELEAQLQQDQAEIKNAARPSGPRRSRTEALQRTVQRATSSIHAFEWSLRESAGHCGATGGR